MGEADPLAALLESIAAEFDVAMGRPEKVRADCARLREHLARPPTAPDLERLRRLAALLRQRMGPIAVPLFELLEEQAAASDDPWPLARGAAAEPRRRARAEGARAPPSAWRSADPSSSIVASCSSWRTRSSGPALPWARRTLSPRSPGSSAGRGRSRETPCSPSTSSRPGAASAAWPPGCSTSPGSRRLSPSPRACSGRRPTRSSPRTSATRARRTATSSTSCPTRDARRRPSPRCGGRRRPAARPCCGEVIAELGWARVNLGLEVRPRVGVSLGGSVPLMVSPAEAPLLEILRGGPSDDRARG